MEQILKNILMIIGLFISIGMIIIAITLFIIIYKFMRDPLKKIRKSIEKKVHKK